MLLLASFLSGIIFLLFFKRNQSIQVVIFLSLIFSYQIILLISMALDIPLDIYNASDTPNNRINLAFLNIIFYYSIFFGSLLMREASSLSLFTRPLNNSLEKNIFFLIMTAIIMLEPFVMSMATLSGNYITDEKPGYFFEYVSLLFIVFFYRYKPREVYFFIPIFCHLIFCILSGERLMFLTGVFSILFSIKPVSLKYKHFFYLAIVVFFMILIDQLRGSTQIDMSNFTSNFIFDDSYQITTHHGSILYSSMALLDFSGILNENFFQKTLNGFIFLFGFDGSTHGDGFAAEISGAFKRGGGGLISTYFLALFGEILGFLALVFYGALIGKLIMAYEKNIVSPMRITLLAFAPHAIIYNPILIFKPLFLLAFTYACISLFKSINTKYL